MLLEKETAKGASPTLQTCCLKYRRKLFAKKYDHAVKTDKAS
jgi:hypothetical protein